MSAAATPYRGVVALDGPAGTGKSTVARRLADRLGIGYLDTGAMYRAATVAVLDAGADLGDPDAIEAAVYAVGIEITLDPDDVEVTVDGTHVEQRIRSAEVTQAVSAVSAVPAVRTRLVAQQRELIRSRSVVAEGRDITTVVWPHADLKVFLTADPEVRALRRAGELGTDRLDSVAADLTRRDAYDSSRATSPLVQAADAVEVDTTSLTIDQVVDLLVDLALRAQTAAESERSEAER